MRLDKYLSARYGSRTKAAEAIASGLVRVNGKIANAAYDYNDGDLIEISKPEVSFVSNGGYKLDKAIKDFNFDVRGKTVVDVGASNGGFTDCLFQHGVHKVYCIDVGENQLDSRLHGKNIVIIDNFNARNLTREIFKEKIDGAVIDVSFISLTYILRQVAEVLDEGAFVIALIKPQFECESKKVGKNGIVKDASIHKKVITKIYDFAQEAGLATENITNAPLRDGKNMEYLILLKKCSIQKLDKNQIFKYVKL